VRGVDIADRAMSPPASKPPATPPPKSLYANYFEVGHTAFEFVLDFGQAYSGKPVSPCHTRIVTGPVYARALLEMLQRAVTQYDETFGRSDE
jgi:uncharacterized protein DUF3467